MLSDGVSVDWASAWILGELVDEVTFGVALEIHRAHKLGIAQLEYGETDETDSTVVDQPGLDVFGQSLPLKKISEINCPNCDRNLAAARFAPHLEKCMGMGRNSSRLASRRIASSTKMELAISDDDMDDDEWISDKKKKRKEKVNSPRRPKKSKNSSDLSYSVEDGSWEQLPVTERKNVLNAICGVVSEHTGRLCTKSLRCPQHSDDQRKELRQTMGVEDVDSVKEIDVDTWEQEDPISFFIGTEPPSPAESTSTTASTGSGSSKRYKTKKK